MGIRQQSYQQMFTFAPSQKDHVAATRIMISVAVPLGILVLLGREDLTIFAAFGTFTSIYARLEKPQMRFRHQSQAGLILSFATGVGLLLGNFGANPWVLILTCSLVGAIGSMLAIRWSLRPAGGIFFIFATGAIGSIPPNGIPFQSLLLTVLAAGFSVLMGFVFGWFGEGTRGIIFSEPPNHGLTNRQVLERGLYFFLTTLAAGVIGELSGLSHSYWAQVAAAAVLLGANTVARVVRGINRVLGTFGGILITAFFISLQPDTWHVLVLVVLSQFLGEMFVLRNYGFAMLFITPLAMFMIYLANPFTNYELLTARLLETAIGSAVGMLGVIITPAQELVNKDTVAVPVLRVARTLKK
ncbi:FUSC family protein [Rothia aerolata]|uniref:FUSC family protein n=1 Tax=Rothia aerolata TaxID=1812262 RepID=A0A917IWE5_9MICC|nr:FUSC family protein [Rothia aerolata]